MPGQGNVCVIGASLGSARFHPAVTGGTGIAPARLGNPAQLRSIAASQHQAMLDQLVVQSAIALGIMLAASLVLGWVIAGRAVRPIHTITQKAQRISVASLHERLGFTGPDDELKRLGDTIDALLGRLEDAFAAQRHFIASVSHELRTPLTVMRAIMQVTLTDPVATTEAYRAACNDVLAEGQQAERIIEALLVLARGERGLDHREPFDLADTAAVLSSHGGGPTRLGHSLRAAPASGDPRLAERLIANLVDNALRHNVPGGEVQVRTGRRGGRSFLEVTNTGSVVPPETVSGLFLPFVRLPSSDPGGLGLGLSIVAAIARAHDATLTARPNLDGGLHVGVSFGSASPAEPPATANRGTRTVRVPRFVRPNRSFTHRCDAGATLPGR